MIDEKQQFSCRLQLAYAPHGTAAMTGKSHREGKGEGFFMSEEKYAQIQYDGDDLENVTLKEVGDAPKTENGLGDVAFEGIEGIAESVREIVNMEKEEKDSAMSEAGAYRPPAGFGNPPEAPQFAPGQGNVPQGEKFFGQRSVPQGENYFGQSNKPQGENYFGQSNKPQGENYFGQGNKPQGGKIPHHEEPIRVREPLNRREEGMNVPEPHKTSEEGNEPRPCSVSEGRGFPESHKASEGWSCPESYRTSEGMVSQNPGGGSEGKGFPEPHKASEGMGSQNPGGVSEGIESQNLGGVSEGTAKFSEEGNAPGSSKASEGGNPQTPGRASQGAEAQDSSKASQAPGKASQGAKAQDSSKAFPGSDKASQAPGKASENAASQEMATTQDERMGRMEESLESISRIMRRLEKKFESEILNSETRDSTVKTIYKELNEYKAGLVEKALKEVLYDFIDIREMMFSKAKYMQKEGKEAVISLEEFLSYAEDIGDILEKHDVSIYKGEPGTSNVATRQKIVRKVETEDEALAKTVAESLSYGYEYNGKVIYPEKISVYVKKK